MKKRNLILPLICVMIIFSIPSVKAVSNNVEVSDRHIAIASALSYVPLQEGKKMSENFDIKDFKTISEIVNLVNGKVNLHDYATIEELDDWIVDDYHNKEISEKSMAVFTLRKDNNIVIVFRGTDFEALADVAYGFTNYHNQEEYADKYVLEILKNYSQKEGNFNIYVTGHSLGGYLAQTAGATIEQNISEYKNLKLVRIVNFNGIGINFLTMLGDKINYGNQAERIKTLKKLGEEGRLIEYYTYGDLVSALGVHYGEMRMLLPSIDSISYHRENNVVLADINQTINFGAKIEEIIKRDNLNIFKTEIHGAKKLYQLDESIVAFLVLTHEADTFVTIELEKSMHKPEIKVLENKKGLIAQLANGQTEFEIKDSITLKAITNYASVKKYEWYVSSNQKDWELVKTSTIDVNDEKYDSNAKPTNLYDVNIEDFEKGETKYFKIIAYYNDNYVSSKYNKNSTTGQYEYVEQKEKSKNEGYKIEETIIQVTHQTKLGMLKDWITSSLTKNNYISGIFNIFTQLKGNIKSGNFIDGITGVLSGFFDLFFKEEVVDPMSGIAEGKIAEVIGDLSKPKMINLLGYLGSLGNSAFDYGTETIEGISDILFNKDSKESSEITDFKDVISNENNSNEDKENKSDILDNNDDLDEYEYKHEGTTYRLAVPNTVLSGVINEIENQNYAEQDSNSIAYNHIQMLLGPDPKSLEYEEGVVRKLRDCINNHQVCNVHVTNDQWIVCVGYRNNVDVEKLEFKDFLFISSNNGSLITGSNSEAKGFYSLDQHDAIYPYQYNN